MSEDFLIEIKVKNGRLMKAIRTAGFTTISGFCRQYDISYQNTIAVMGLKTTPIDKKGVWRPIAIKLSEALRVLPEDLFPEAWRDIVLKKNKIERFVSLEDVLALQQAPLNPELMVRRSLVRDQIEDELESLFPRYAAIVRMRFGLDGDGEKTLKECGEKFGVGVERARGMIEIGLRHLGHRARREKMHTCLETFDEDN